MYLNYPLVPGFPLTLRDGEERDRDFLSDVFADVWERIPEKDRAAILARGYGQVAVDVLEIDVLREQVDTTGNIHLNRAKVDNSPHNIVAHFVARQLALKVDDFHHPNVVAALNAHGKDAKKRVTTILGRWGYPPRAKPRYTVADNERIQANSKISQPEKE